MNNSWCLFIIFHFLVCVCTSKNLPSFITKCKRHYPEVNKCLLQRADELKPYLEKGIPELNFPSLKPLIIPKLEVHTGNGGSTDFSAKFENIRVDHLLEDFEIKELDFNIDNNKIDLTLFIPKIRIRTTYTFKGNIFALQLSSTGPSDGNLTDIYGFNHVNSKIITKNGKQYLDITDNTLTAKYSISRLRFENIFEGNEELTEQTNKALNENIDEIGKDIKPLIEEAIRGILQRLIQQIFNDYSLDELFV
ncbi:hypothetical protein ILUMI_27513 [Ignelater luminosus]|uniref:Uncharacterized protein n=1 Tax=Ignelater luminosus TaxID=2038154 RepID=A0A8K0FY36_IGNLU|nr:hypothetical protein ILUMI_27513 [Ignelater luminosus]